MNQKTKFLHCSPKLLRTFKMELTIRFFLQLTTGGSIPELAGEALKAMQNGTAFQYAKPLLVAEVRHIFPSVAGVPMEFSLYAAAVAAGNLKGKSLKCAVVYL